MAATLLWVELAFGSWHRLGVPVSIEIGRFMPKSEGPLFWLQGAKSCLPSHLACRRHIVVFGFVVDRFGLAMSSEVFRIQSAAVRFAQETS
jgi:hypothetical protein